MKVARYSFQDQYLPSLSVNYVAINKHLEKLPLVVLDKLKFVMIRVAKTSDRSCYSNKMTPLPTAITCSDIFWHHELFLQNRLRELFFSNTFAS